MEEVVDDRVLDVGLLVSSLGRAVEVDPWIVQRFYLLLFQMLPGSARMFRVHIGGQRPTPMQINQVTETLKAGVEHANDHEWLRTALGDLGRWHQRNRRIPPECYPFVKSAITHTLAAAMGPEVWEQVGIQWIVLLDRLAYYMLLAYEEQRELGAAAPPERTAITETELAAHFVATAPTLADSSNGPPQVPASQPQRPSRQGWRWPWGPIDK
jgi:hemoglobin-like flavoprotein